MKTLKEAFFNILVDNISDMVFVMKVNNDGEFVYEYLNSAALDITGYDESVIGHSLHEVNPDILAVTLQMNYRKALHDKGIVTYQDSYVTPHGETRYSDTTVTPIFDQDNRCTYIIAVVEDITNSLNTIRKLEESEELFQIIVENAGDLVTLINDKGEIIFASPSYKKVLGFDHREFNGKLFIHNVHHDDRFMLSKKFVKGMKKKKEITAVFRQYDRENHLIWSELNGSPVFDANGKFKYAVIVTRDISKQKEYEAQLEYFALHDSLTGLANRRYFNQQLTKILADYKIKYDGLAIVMLDIDNFKIINDQMGHDIGDKVIEEYAKRISQAVDEKDTIARLGGDEFIVLLPGITSTEEVVLFAENIKNLVGQPWDIKGYKPKVTSSIGITIASSTNVTSYTLLKNVDMALYKAKNSGGNTYRFKS